MLNFFSGGKEEIFAAAAGAGTDTECCCFLVRRGMRLSPAGSFIFVVSMGVRLAAAVSGSLGNRSSSREGFLFMHLFQGISRSHFFLPAAAGPGRTPFRGAAADAAIAGTFSRQQLGDHAGVQRCPSEGSQNDQQVECRHEQRYYGAR